MPKSCSEVSVEPFLLYLYRYIVKHFIISYIINNMTTLITNSNNDNIIFYVINSTTDNATNHVTTTLITNSSNAASNFMSLIRVAPLSAALFMLLSREAAVNHLSITSTKHFKKKGRVTVVTPPISSVQNGTSSVVDSALANNAARFALAARAAFIASRIMSRVSAIASRYACTRSSSVGCSTPTT